METVSMPVYQDLLATSVVQVSEIEGLKAGARVAQAEIERLRAECVVMDRAVLRMHEGRATAAAFEEAAKIAEGFVDKEIDPVYHSSPLNEYRTIQSLQIAAAIRAKAKGSEVVG